MKKMNFIFVIVLSVFSLSSCLELEENITINPDKSGEYSLKIDLGILSTIGKDKIPSEILSLPNTIGNTIKTVSGISNVEILNSSKIHGISFHFVNQKSFKKAIAKLVSAKYDIITPNYLKINNHRFKKKDIQKLIRDSIAKDNSGLFEQSFMGKSIFSLITVKSTINTPTKIKKIKKNINAKTSSDKQVVIKTNLSDILNGMNTGVVIKY